MVARSRPSRPRTTFSSCPPRSRSSARPMGTPARTRARRWASTRVPGPSGGGICVFAVFCFAVWIFADAHARHGRHLLLFRFSGGARWIIRWETTYWGELGPRGVLLAYVRRSSRGLRAAERALRPRARRHPARGLHPKPPAIYRSVGRRATRGGILWVRVGLAEQPRRLIDATRDHGEAASSSRIFFFSFFCCLLLAKWVVSVDTQEREREKGKKVR